jgi:predicted extracellular nuclease
MTDTMARLHRLAILSLALAATLLLGAAPGPTFTAGGAPRAFDVQGRAHVSPLAGQQVDGVAGVVTALRPNGFYLQDPDGDGDPVTSDAVFVFTRAAPSVAVGDGVVVSGRVEEFRPGNDAANLSLTEIVVAEIAVVSRDNLLPPAVVLGNGGRAIPTRLVADEFAGDLDLAPLLHPDESYIDSFESLEGMRVQVNDAVAVGPRAARNELPVLPDEGAGVVGRTVRGGVVAGPPGTTAPMVVLTDGGVRTPPAIVGDRFPGASVGVVDYAFGRYIVRLTNLPSLIFGGVLQERAAPPDPEQVSIASFNVENLGPRDARTRIALLAATIADRLGGPDLVAVEEMQDDSGTTDDGIVTGTRTTQVLIDAIRTAGGPAYEYREIAPANGQDGGEPGGNIRVGFLFRTDRGLAFVDRAGGDATTPTAVVADDEGVHVSASPGRVQPDALAWTDSRKPLVGEVTFNGHRLIVIGNHFASKRGSGPDTGRFQPPAHPTDARRVEQATLVNGFVRALLAADPSAKVVVLGDLNDVPTSATLAALRGDVLTNLLDLLPESERYSYVFEGRSEAVDQILVSPALLDASPVVDVVHVNAEFATHASDHDPVVARFTLPAR